MTLEEAKAILKGQVVERSASNPRGVPHLQNAGRLDYFHWFRGSDAATLDGDFTADELEALAVLMRAGWEAATA